MPRPKKVAIIGAGPSGLVTAKTLLHNYPEGTFAPTIFEKERVLGGLWSVDSPDRANTASKGNDPARRGHQEQRRKHPTTRGFVSPSMRTNLSRFTVGFSDLAWESVFGTEDASLSLFPQAWQVGRYLEKYAERYIPPSVVRLGCRVVTTVRESEMGKDCDDGDKRRWMVQWIEVDEGKEELDENDFEKSENLKGENLHSERFDFLVVASGYFSRPYIPDVSGLADIQDRVVHSSALRDVEQFLSNLPCDELPLEQGTCATGGKRKLVVIGGSMSGAETASALALHLSSSAHAPESLSSSAEQWKGYTVHHVCSRPFWSVPTYLPKPAGPEKDSVPSFQPLDLVMYDLSRRPPGEIQYNLGPVTPERASMMSDYFKSILGTDQSDLGAGNLSPSGEAWKDQPPWVAISDSYAEYVRSGAINVTIGRVCTVNQDPASSSSLAKLEIRLADGNLATMDDVTAIVLATGFTPFDSLSFLPEDVLSKLEYSTNDPFLPIILDGKACMNAEVPDLGFVGLYRGPYWGVMEMQARRLAQIWARNDYTASLLPPDELLENEKEIQLLHNLRRAAKPTADPNMKSTQRSQFPMGDYVGLMESFARDLGISRFELPGYENRTGPVVPARYTLPVFGSETKKQMSETETAITLDSLRTVLGDKNSNIARRSVAKAIFRSLHGTWKFSRRERTGIGPGKDPSGSAPGEVESFVSVSGTATFHPRYPSEHGYESEYLYKEVQNSNDFISTSTSTPSSSTPGNRSRSVFRLRDTAPDDNLHIRIWSVDMEKYPNVAARLSHGLEFGHTIPPRHGETQAQTSEREKGKEKAATTGRSIYRAKGKGTSNDHPPGNAGKNDNTDSTELGSEGGKVLSFCSCKPLRLLYPDILDFFDQVGQIGTESLSVGQDRYFFVFPFFIYVCTVLLIYLLSAKSAQLPSKKDLIRKPILLGTSGRGDLCRLDEDIPFIMQAGFNHCIVP
ncbi:hypothetical protein VTN00DRAFT_9701 [Thermoascus crustaceus]|uniref:uncharacterized protein n=1 Tax=Thermoascus crustaceus TaxID=5088 RepID=UPI003743DF49